ncbi:hypothetical protein NQ317_004183 [Molorchus minor]|uniref:DUF1758 domain-containing protein n=1 Tax=Molorchus minor TaxID=1323400 RepID=A0ABQ9JCU3_9CUCU|nr:hypothetical protein NQ317_004183 [Molorchus minor]
MAEVALEIRKRGLVKAKLTNFSKFVKKIQDKESVADADILQLTERLKTLELVKVEFDEIQNLIEMSVENVDLKNQYTIRFEFEDDYFTQIALAKQIIHDNDESDSNLNLKNIKLPTINLPKFTGIYQNWLEFRDTFRSLIHDNISISNVQKFHYLRASLESDAALVIKSLEISSANYEVAWNALLERYDNKLLIHNHIKSLFNGEIIHKESSSGIRKLIDDFSKNLRALEQLQQPVKEWDALLVYIISLKLDNTTLREWENSKSELEQPKFQDIKSFLNARADMLEMVAQNSVDKRKNYSYNTRSFLATENPDIRQCVICRDTHYVQNCKNFLKLSPAERDKRARSLHLCINCLKRGHHSKVCRRGTCNKCSKKHHTLLHQEPCAQPTLSNSNPNANVENTLDVADTSVETSVTLSACGSVDHVFLSTAYVQVIAQDGSTHTIRALLDCGAQSSFITKRVSERLKLNTLSANVSVRSVNNISSNVRSKCKLTVQSLYNNYSSNQWFFVIDTIAEDVPAVTIDVSKLAVPDHINLADPTFFKPSKIDMLIGSDLFWDLLCVGQLSLGLNNPVLQKTKFGWIISGPINLKTDVVICNLLQYLDEEPDV